MKYYVTKLLVETLSVKDMVILEEYKEVDNVTEII